MTPARWVRKITFREMFMSICSSSKDEFGWTLPRFVIPAHAGIQVCFSDGLAWIPAFAGMTELIQLRRFEVILEKVFSREDTKGWAKNLSPLLRRECRRNFLSAVVFTVVFFVKQAERGEHRCVLDREQHCVVFG